MLHILPRFNQSIAIGTVNYKNHATHVFEIVFPPWTILCATTDLKGSKCKVVICGRLDHKTLRSRYINFDNGDKYAVPYTYLVLHSCFENVEVREFSAKWFCRHRLVPELLCDGHRYLSVCVITSVRGCYSFAPSSIVEYPRFQHSDFKK